MQCNAMLNLYLSWDGSVLHWWCQRRCIFVLVFCILYFVFCILLNSAWVVPAALHFCQIKVALLTNMCDCFPRSKAKDWRFARSTRSNIQRVSKYIKWQHLAIWKVCFHSHLKRSSGLNFPFQSQQQGENRERVKNIFPNLSLNKYFQNRTNIIAHF